ncbi:hypothetical protein WMY93_029887 [Mugilogobius chulae]|uniref:Reelin domain-containing protein n=1 Tax=Mugilogobius chulae TaxID=88201 RepID=A0AAW0ML53_9GOBI
MEGRALLLSLVFCCCVLLGVDGYSNGKVTEVCGSMTPEHGVSAQTAASPFTVTTDKSNYTNGEDVTVTLKSTVDSTFFEGFLLQAREVGGSSAVGAFLSPPSGTQTLTCGSVTNSALSHTSSLKQNNVQVKWRPSGNKDVQFYVTFVQSKATFWVKVMGSTIKVNGTSSSTSAPAAAPLSVLLMICMYWAL